MILGLLTAAYITSIGIAYALFHSMELLGGYDDSRDLQVARLFAAIVTLLWLRGAYYTLRAR